MKIPHSIVAQYEAFIDKYGLLASSVKEVMNRDVKNERWLYLYRLKSIESFYVKAQTRRWSAVKEDIFACTIVVENASQILDAIKLLENFFVLQYRRPEDSGFTKKRPDSFVFDDLRLYLTLKERDSNPETENLVFECQVKTFLQHAWSPGGLVVEDPPANAGDTGSIPSPRRFYPQLVKPACPRACAPQQEKPPQ